jgi:hypothetical protein
VLQYDFSPKYLEITLCYPRHNVCQTTLYCYRTILARIGARYHDNARNWKIIISVLPLTQFPAPSHTVLCVFCRMETYIIIIEQHDVPSGRLYGAFVPDVPGCTAMGPWRDAGAYANCSLRGFSYFSDCGVRNSTAA